MKKSYDYQLIFHQKSWRLESYGLYIQSTKRKIYQVLYLAKISFKRKERLSYYLINKTERKTELQEILEKF